MLATPPNPATISLSLSHMPNPATIPLPPSRVESPLDIGPDKGTNSQRTLYLATQGSEQKHHRTEDARDAKYSSGFGGVSTISNRLSLGSTVGNRSSTWAGTAANIAVRAHHPFEAVDVGIAPSATMASKEAGGAHTEDAQLSSFAHSAAVLAQKAVGEGAAVIIRPHSPSFSGPFNDDEHSAARDTTQIYNAAAKSVFKAMPPAVETLLEATERPQPRRVLTANLEEAARKAAARRLALLDQELYQSGAIRRQYYPDNDRKTRQPVSPRRSYSMRDGATIRSQRPCTDGADPYSNLLDIAKRNVENKLAGIDLQVADKKGIVYRKDWEDQAMRLAETRARNLSSSSHRSKIDIGGGGYVDAEVVERIAQRNVQPVLDEITARAEAERARVAAERADAEEKKRLEYLEKERNREIKIENRRAKAAEKSEITRQRSEAKRQKRVSKFTTQGKVGTVGDKGTNCTTQNNSSHGSAEAAVTREIPTPLPPQESKSRLRKLIGKLRRSMTPSSTGSEGGGFIGGASYLQERERHKEREGRVVTSAETAGKDREQLNENVAHEERGTLRGMVDYVSPNQDVVFVEGNLPATPTGSQQDIESGEVFWDRVEYLGSGEYTKRQTKEHVGHMDRRAISSILTSTKETMASRPIDGIVGVESKLLHPPLQKTLPPGRNVPFDSSGGYSEPVESHVRNYRIDKGGPAYMDTGSSMIGGGGGREVNSSVPLYGYPTQYINVTLMQPVGEALGEAQRQTSIMAEGDGGSRPIRVKSVKSVRIRDPRVGQQILATQAPHNHHSFPKEHTGSDGNGKGPQGSKFHEEL